MSWLFLSLAIIAEVAATLSLKMAATGADGRLRARSAGLQAETGSTTASATTVATAVGSAGTGRRRRLAWFAIVVVGYTVAFTLLALALADGMGLGVAYGIWTAAGVALTALLSRVLFGEPMTRLMVIGIVIIIVGVLLIEIGASH